MECYLAFTLERDMEIGAELAHFDLGRLSDHRKCGVRCGAIVD
jgi:hypothetical protein